MTIEQGIIYWIVAWVVGFFLQVSLFYTLDKKNKTEFPSVTSTYRLYRCKWLFVYYNYQKSEITKSILWIIIVQYVFSLVFFALWVLLILLRNQALLILTAMFVFIPLVVLSSIAIWMTLHKALKHEKLKKQQQQEVALRSQKEKEEWLKNRAKQQQQSKQQIEKPQPSTIHQETPHDKNLSE